MPALCSAHVVAPPPAGMPPGLRVTMIVDRPPRGPITGRTADRRASESLGLFDTGPPASPSTRPPGSRPTRFADALSLRLALERPAAAQAENVANAFGPPIGQAEGGPALHMHHLSLFEDAVRAQDYRARADRAHRIGCGHRSPFNVARAGLWSGTGTSFLTEMYHNSSTEVQFGHGETGRSWIAVGKPLSWQRSRPELGERVTGRNGVKNPPHGPARDDPRRPTSVLSSG
jgi:hypothetical protein